VIVTLLDPIRNPIVVDRLARAEYEHVCSPRAWLATPEPIKDWSLTSLKEKLIKIGAKVVSHGRYVAFQMAEVAIPRQMFQEILRCQIQLMPPRSRSSERATSLIFTHEHCQTTKEFGWQASMIVMRPDLRGSVAATPCPCFSLLTLSCAVEKSRSL
jgi:hypothetical protein